MQDKLLTEKYDDLSTETHLQYKFYCDRCNAAHTTPRYGKPKDPSSKEAGVERTLNELVIQARLKFRHCKICKKWVCSELCWHSIKCACEDCAATPFGDVSKISNSGAVYSSILGAMGREKTD